MNEIISYLSDLKNNNNRDWFHAHKAAYTSAREKFLKEVQTIISHLQLADPGLSDLDARDTVFRIFRDVRFSNDKTPYKTHFSAYMAKGGRKSRNAGYYLHLSDDEFFIAAGVHTPASEDLKVIRQEILFQAEAFKTILKTKQAEGFSLMETDKLKNGPKDFPKDSPHIELLKYKHFILSKNLDRTLLDSKDAAKVIAGHFESLIPFTTFLNTALEYVGNE